jgi:hypothetical protein
MRDASSCETSVSIYQTTRRNIPEDIHLIFVIFSVQKTVSS